MIYTAKYDGREYSKDIDPTRDGRWRDSLKEFAEEAVRSWNLRTSRKEPVSIKVVIWKQAIESGKIVERKACEYSVMPYCEPMTEAEFNEERDEALSQLPPEFRGFVSSYAWEQGHSSGREEVMIYVHDLVNELKGPIKEFEVRLKREH